MAVLRERGAMGHAQLCRPSLAVERYPPETADYLLRSAERSELRAENAAAGLGGVEYEPVGHYLKTQHLTCQLCTPKVESAILARMFHDELDFPLRKSNLLVK